MIHQHELKAEYVRVYTLKTSTECSNLDATGADLAQLANGNTVVVSV